ncbi:hypothetical protein OK074_5312 [Actinobacteria bacterium OK074]|nr:hypothetical protein OK074_5312 [Actinobacteria bacterium OK074]
MTQTWSGQWTKGNEEYDVLAGGEVNLSTGQGAQWAPSFEQYSGKVDSDGSPIADTTYTPDGYDRFTTDGAPFKVPARKASYRLTASVHRNTKAATASSRIDVSWTFHSTKPPTDAPVQLPVSTVHFGTKTDLTSRVPAARTATLPVTVEGAAHGHHLKSLTVYVSYDHGHTWKRAEVRNGKVTVVNPAKGKAISLWARVTDAKGDSSRVTIYDAYFGK